MNMAADINDEAFIARYLLGELPEEEQARIEDRAFADRDYFAIITAVENDLIDGYVRQELSETERRQFENRFLASAERRKRVEFARTFASIPLEAAVVEPARRSVVAPAVPSWRESLEAFIRGLNPAARFAMAAAMLLVLAGGAWLLTETLRSRNESTQMQAENQSRQIERKALEQQVEIERRRNEELSARLNQEKQQREQSAE